MSRKGLSPNAACPCGSDKEYGDCCHGKEFDYLVDDEGNIFKSIPMTDELAEVIEEQKREFTKKYGREPGPGDNLFFNMPPLEHAEHFMVEAMKQAGLDPAIIYAFEKTGLMVTEANEHLISDVDLEEWDEAITEYKMEQLDGESSGEEYF